ncbi:hypothetical protein BaRGS_00000703 [Batillaria attramentaria]|uniref:Cation/H+ exchanger transmembrane domain-containing protein n=1 Tax=Batillaria attramentaria TaxID=370345 RepID=A0ABD0M902_9CAEN
MATTARSDQEVSLLPMHIGDEGSSVNQDGRSDESVATEDTETRHRPTGKGSSSITDKNDDDQNFGDYPDLDSPTPLLPQGKAGTKPAEIVLEHDDTVSKSRRLQKLQACFSRVTAPIEAVNHPLPDNPTKLDKFKRAFFCPPFGRVGAFLLVAVVFLVWWGVLISITKEKALPGGVVFPMLMLFVCCWCGGYLINLVRLPPLFGMLLMGGILGNVPGIDVGRQIDPAWSSTARNMALAVILMKAGLGLDPVALKRLSLVVVRLAFCPSLVEAAVDGVAAHLILGLPWDWAYCLAFVLSVVSPAVIVPSMLSLSDRGYGLNKGIPTLVVAAVSLDAVLAITGFGVMLGIIFTSGSIVWAVVKGPIEIVAGITGGCLGGVLLWYIPQKSSKHVLLFRSVLLVGAGFVTIFGSKYVGWSGSGPLACIAVPFVAAHGWRKEFAKGQKIVVDDDGDPDPVEEVMGVLWMVFQPLLFGLIGAKVDLSQLQPHTVGLGMAVLFTGMAFRLTVAFLTMLRSELNTKERIFIPFSWTPKATVQAAIGGIALDTAIELNAGPEAVELGRKVLTLAVLAILVTAPVGALLIALLGPKLLHKTEPGELYKEPDEAVAQLENGDAKDIETLQN